MPAAPQCALLEVSAIALELVETEIISIKLIQKKKFKSLGKTSSDLLYFSFVFCISHRINSGHLKRKTISCNRH